jgi:hypothetical protein
VAYTVAVNTWFIAAFPWELLLSSKGGFSGSGLMTTQYVKDVIVIVMPRI